MNKETCAQAPKHANTSNFTCTLKRKRERETQTSRNAKRKLATRNLTHTPNVRLLIYDEDHDDDHDNDAKYTHEFVARTCNLATKKMQRVRKRYQRMAPYCKRRRGDGATRGWRPSNTLKATASHVGDQHTTQSLVAAVLQVSHYAVAGVRLVLAIYLHLLVCQGFLGTKRHQLLVCQSVLQSCRVSSVAVAPVIYITAFIKHLPADASTEIENCCCRRRLDEDAAQLPDTFRTGLSNDDEITESPPWEPGH